MSGECYSAKKRSMDNATGAEVNFESAELKRDPGSIEILEYKTVVSSAENKCNQLRSQIEKIKQLYNSKHGTEGQDNTKVIKIPTKLRQSSQIISTDNTGTALGTINSILAGITKPVDKSKFIQPVESTNANYITLDQLRGVEKVKINSKSKQSISIRSKSKVNPIRTKSKVASIASSTRIKKSARHKENEITKKPVVSVITKRSKRIPLKARFANKDISKEVYHPRDRFIPKNPDLVEIYHNTAVKESKSSDSDLTKKKSEEKKSKTNPELIPPLTIERSEEPEARGTVSCIYKNYTMPTISSRMKQAAKCYINTLNMKTIPFCLSTSTSPSHNIGINIQQVMSMLKSRQPVGKLSPTLAYNIGLAASREENILPFETTSLLSKGFNPQCPLSKSALNYPYLQEVAKTVPQDTIEEVDENEDKSPDTHSIIITGPSGDVKVKNKKMTTWSANPDEERCTCVVPPPKGTSFQQIVNKFNTGAITKNKMSIEVPIIFAKAEPKNMIPEMKKEEAANANFVPLQNKERKLKEVLGKLHNEFQTMTKTYDDLVKKTQDGTASPNTVTQIEILDKELNSKEEEIVMVMSLYKEVLALKEQVKTLKERTSKENICAMKNPATKFSAYNNVTTAGLLNQLLQRVQHFQTHYKKH